MRVHHPPRPPTGFLGTTAIDIIYGGTSIGSSGTLSRGFVSSSLLRGEYDAIVNSARLTCATGTTLEHGWYRSSAPKTRVGTGSVASRGGATVYRGDYTPTFSSEYQFLAYCTEGSGMSKVYSTAVNLMGTNGKVSLTGGPPAPPTLVGFTKVARVEYGRLRSTAPGSGDWQVDWRYVHGNALGTEIGVSNDVTCETGTAVEWGWYESNAPTTRVSGAPFLGQISIGDAAPGEYQALAYCTRGSGVSKVYSIAVNLMGANGKVMISLEPTGWDSTLASPGGLSATPSPGAVRIDWSAVTGATNYQYRYKEGRANDRDPCYSESSGWSFWRPSLPTLAPGTPTQNPRQRQSAPRLRNNRLYCFQVRTIKGSSHSSPSPSPNDHPLTGIPSRVVTPTAPTGVTAGGMPGAAHLTWDVQSGVTGFQVQWKAMADTTTACGTSSYGN